MTQAPQSDNKLHIPDLSIKGFCGIKDLSIPKLGRVTLLTGKNSVGKTTVLEAVSLYAARGDRYVFYELLTKRDEIIKTADRKGFRPPSILNIASLFHGRNISKNPLINIGPQETKTGRLTMEVISPNELSKQQKKVLERLEKKREIDIKSSLLKVKFKNNEYIHPIYSEEEDSSMESSRMLEMLNDDTSQFENNIKHRFLGPGLEDSNEIAEMFNDIVLTPEENLVVDSLELILGEKVSRTAVINVPDPYYSHRRRVQKQIIMTQLKDKPDPVPLKSFGDGVVRLFTMALALANSSNGILLIDEAENGIHYSLQQQFWDMILKTARHNNTQVLATTHSWDCVKGFAKAAVADQDSEGVLIRLEQNGENIKAVPYLEKDLKVVADQDIEVR